MTVLPANDSAPPADSIAAKNIFNMRCQHNDIGKLDCINTTVGPGSKRCSNLLSLLLIPTCKEQLVALLLLCCQCAILRIAPILAAHLQVCAPGIDLRFAPMHKRNAFALTDDGSVDILIGVFAQIPARFFQKKLFSDEFVCIARKGHPQIKKNLTLKLFTQLPHVLMTLNEDSSGAVDKALKARGL